MQVELESAKTPWHDVDILSYQSVDNASMAFHEVSHFYLSTRRAQETHCSESPRFPYFGPQEDHNATPSRNLSLSLYSYSTVKYRSPLTCYYIRIHFIAIRAHPKQKITKRETVGVRSSVETEKL